MPRRLMDNLECEVIGEEIHEGGFGEDNVGIMQNYRLEKRSKGKNNYIFVIKNQLFSKIIISILAIIIDKD